MGQPNYIVIFLGGICWIILITVLFIPFIILLVSKYVVLLVAYIFRKDLHSVSTGDAAFTIGCSWKKSKLSVGLLCHVQGHLKLEQVQNRFSSCLLDAKVGDKPKYDKLYSCLVTFCGYVFRKALPPDSIDLSTLIYERRLEAGETIEMLAGNWMDKAYGKFSPAWELMVIPIDTKINNGHCKIIEETVIAFKIHHVFADGYSLLHILDTLTGGQSPYLVKEANDSVWKTISDAISMPLNLRMLGGVGGPRTNPLKVDVPQKKWIYTFTTVDLGPIKTIRRKYDVHFATIIISLIVGSIRQFILETKTEKELPSHFSIANTLPCEKHPSQSQILCNHWTLGVIKSPIKSENPLDRILETEKYFEQFHEAGLHKVAVNYLFPMAWMFPQYLAELALEKDVAGFNCGLTSLVGANNYEFLGKPITHIRPLLNLIDSHPFTVFSWFTFSHSNKLDITLAGAPDLFPDRSSLAKIVSQYFPNEYKALCTQCGIPTTNL